MANAALRHALLVEAGFTELLHPRTRAGRFREKLGVPHSKRDIVRRPLRTGEFPLGNALPEPRSGPKPNQVGIRRRLKALADSDLSHGGVAHPGKTSPGVNTHYNAEGHGGRPRNVQRMGDKKLRHLLTHPATAADLRERVRAEIVRREREKGITSSPTQDLAAEIASRRERNTRAAAQTRSEIAADRSASSLEDMTSRLPSRRGQGGERPGEDALRPVFMNAMASYGPGQVAYESISDIGRLELMKIADELDQMDERGAAAAVVRITHGKADAADLRDAAEWIEELDPDHDIARWQVLAGKLRELSRHTPSHS